MPRKRNKKLSFSPKDNLTSDILIKFFKHLTSGKKKKTRIRKSASKKSEDKESSVNAGFFVEKKLNMNLKRNYFSVAAVFLLIVSWVMGYILIESKNDSNGIIAGVFEENAAVSSSTDPAPGIVKGEKITGSTSTALLIDSELMSSQNYSIKQMHFGGDLAVISNSLDASPLAINNVKSEVLVARNMGKEENKLVISWKTNKLAVSTIEYGRAGSPDPIKIKEDSYAFNHSVIISGLAQGTAYNYSIMARDKWGNENQPGHFAAYSGAKTVSVFELIAKTLVDIFGWAGAKK